MEGGWGQICLPWPLATASTIALYAQTNKKLHIGTRMGKLHRPAHSGAQQNTEPLSAKFYLVAMQ
jgi:hypothetical protein